MANDGKFVVLHDDDDATSIESNKRFFAKIEGVCWSRFFKVVVEVL